MWGSEASVFVAVAESEFILLQTVLATRSTRQPVAPMNREPVCEPINESLSKSGSSYTDLRHLSHLEERPRFPGSCWTASPGVFMFFLCHFLMWGLTFVVITNRCSIFFFLSDHQVLSPWKCCILFTSKSTILCLHGKNLFHWRMRTPLNFLHFGI